MCIQALDVRTHLILLSLEHLALLLCLLLFLPPFGFFRGLAFMLTIRGIVVALWINLKTLAVFCYECLLTKVFNHIIQHWLFVFISGLHHHRIFNLLSPIFRSFGISFSLSLCFFLLFSS